MIQRPIVKIVPAPPGATLVFLVDAQVVEDDRHLVLGADPVPRETYVDPESLLKDARSNIQPVPGTVIARGHQPVRLHAIVHDLDEEPSWREGWVVGALREVFEEVAKRGLHSLALPLLGCVHGSLEPGRFAELFGETLEAAGPENLKEVWLTVPPDVADEIARRLRRMGVEVQEQAKE